MKTTTTTIAAVLALLAAGSASASPVNLITNGDFESIAAGSTFASGYQVVNGGSPDITGWTVGATSVDLIRNAYNAIDGYSIDMLGTPGPGSLSQSFNVVAGHTYNLSFDMARNSNAPAGQGVAVNFGGVLGDFYSTDAASNTLYGHTLSFTAASTGLASLSFVSAAKVGTPYDNYSGAVIDNVAVMAAVPEPETYAMLLAGLGLMGFMRRRKAAK
ncbi:choice-of-anchor C family protein [Janthinobacterium sp. HLX7-2]|uniref:choice-of-anchor C family protein n=1 Tax=Janthinobacterium sp. HLX7-2 TaxID=1259331 RepID=UPI003F2131F5